MSSISTVRSLVPCSGWWEELPSYHSSSTPRVCGTFQFPGVKTAPHTAPVSLKPLWRGKSVGSLIASSTLPEGFEARLTATALRVPSTSVSRAGEITNPADDAAASSSLTVA